MTITEPQAESLLRSDLQRTEKAIRDFVTVPLSQNEYDALCSFIHNVGVNAFHDSTLRKRLEALNYDGAADQLLRWVHDNGKVVKGLENRRRDERLFFTGHGGGV
jgi:lysozyme